MILNPNSYLCFYYTRFLGVHQIATGSDLNIDKIGILVKFLLPAYISIIELCFITVSVVIISRSIVASMAILVSMILGLGHLLMQYSSTIKFFPVLSTMNSFFIFRNERYLSLQEGILCQGIWCILLIIISYILFRFRSVR
ncbi:UNVERIFIED_CONTAM: hypothetical protein Cloal_0873 [Acetivibrio alkalicellulosi]